MLLGAPGTLLGALGRSWDALGPRLDPLGRSWSLRGSILEPLGWILEPPGMHFQWSHAGDNNETSQERRERLATTMQQHPEWGVHYALLESSYMYTYTIYIYYII